MAVYFLDPENGDDSAAGTSFATRWKTFENGATAARIAPGDTIRVIANRDPQLFGQLTWTSGSTQLTGLPSGAVKLLHKGDSAWTPSTSVTCNTNTATYREAIASSRIIPASAFTTGKLAYTAIAGGGTVDLSSYSQISLWVFITTAQANSGTIRLALCSDTTGNTIVNDFSFPAMRADRWIALTFNNGGPLGSSIQSLALYADVDPGTSNIHLDAIIACKAPDDPECITHNSLVSKGDGVWYPLNYVNETVITLDSSIPAGTGTPLPYTYNGPTETVDTYVIHPMPFSDNLYGSGATGIRYGLTPPESGSSGNFITYSGGWNRTDMSTQTGESWIDMHGALNHYGFGSATARTYIKVERIKFARALFCHYFASSGWSNIILEDCGGSGCDAQIDADVITTDNAVQFINCKYFGMRSAFTGALQLGRQSYTGCEFYGINHNPSGMFSSVPYAFDGCTFHLSFSGSWVTSITNSLSFTNCTFISEGGARFFVVSGTTGNTLDLKDCDFIVNSGSPGALIELAVPTDNDVLHMEGCTFTRIDGTVSACVGINDTAGRPATGYIKNCTFSATNATNAGVIVGTANLDNFFMDNITMDIPTATASGFRLSGSNVLTVTNLTTSGIGMAFNASTPQPSSNITVGNWTDSTSAPVSNVTVNAVGYNSSDDNRTWLYSGATLQYEDTVTHSAGKGLKLSVTTASTNLRPSVFRPFAYIPVTSGTTVTIKLWVRKSYTNGSLSLNLTARHIAGIGEDKSVAMSTGVDTWEELELEVTPTQNTVLEPYLSAYTSSAACDFYIDDISVSAS